MFQWNKWKQEICFNEASKRIFHFTENHGENSTSKEKIHAHDEDINIDSMYGLTSSPLRRSDKY